MPYTIVETFKKRIWPGTHDDVEQRFIAVAADMAKTVIDAALCNVFSNCPWSSTPAFIVTISDMMTKDIAIALKSKGGIASVFAKDKPDGMQMAETWLNDLRAGRKDLVGEPRSTTMSASFELESYHPIFDIDDPLKHFPDSDRLDAIDETRRSS